MANQLKRDMSGVPEDLKRLRVEYAELNRLAMLSHLDVLRFLERVVRRAELPYAITHGFSPRMRIAYGAALPVGIGGLHEIFDIYLTEKVPEDEALEALRSATVPDMPMLACAYIDRRATAASVAFPFSTYEVTLSGSAEGLSVPEELRIVRASKKKQDDKILRPEEFLVDGMKAEEDTLRFTLEAKPSGSLRPDALVRAMIADREDLRIQRFMRVALHSTRPE